MYERELEILKPVMESVDRELREFRAKVEEILPPAKALERAVNYRENKAKPLFIKMKNTIAALAARLAEIMQELKRVRAGNRELKAKNNLLISGYDSLVKENSSLKQFSTMFERVVRVLGEGKVFAAVRQDEVREWQEAEQKQVEQLEKEKSIRERLEKAKQDAAVPMFGQPKKKPKSRGMER